MIELIYVCKMETKNELELLSLLDLLPMKMLQDDIECKISSVTKENSKNTGKRTTRIWKVTKSKKEKNQPENLNN